MTLRELPKNITIVGAGAVGIEFAYFYHQMGTKVTLIEYAQNILPLEDEEISKELDKILTKKGITIYTSTKVLHSRIENDTVNLTISTANGEKSINAQIVLSAVGITPNIDNIGLEYCNIKTYNGRIVTDEFYQTNIDGIYAIGDIVKGQALAHVASAEGIIAAEHLAEKKTSKINYNNIPSCIYCTPEIASVGFTEQYLKENKIEYRVGKFPFSASGKAKTMGKKDGFVKVLIDKKYDEILGAHCIGENVSEIIQEIVVARDAEATAESLLQSIHAHPQLQKH
jgi:Pyruvate/2-oxoglutarate dehydrogenase complex, dihydrolipoamide dehydrogenase (E3) component, and related enzymes